MKPDPPARVVPLGEARRAREPAGPPPGDEAPVGPADLLNALSGRSEEMAERLLEIFSEVFPEAAAWSPRRRKAFVEHTRERFDAILAVASRRGQLDEELLADLHDVGTEAAWQHAPLRQLLVILRISRDLVVQTAVQLAEARGSRTGLPLSLLLTRVLPIVDQLTDAVADGYWTAVVDREEQAQARYRHVVEHASDGVFEVDPEGRLSWANAAFALIVGRRLADLLGRPLSEVLGVPSAGEPTEGALTIVRPDGVQRRVWVEASARRAGGEVVGFAGIVRDETVQRELEAEQREFAALVRRDLRAPLAAIVGLGATLESHADELAPAQIARIGRSVRGQAERVSRLADDLSDAGRLQSHQLRLSPRSVELRPVVEAALAGVAGRPEVGVDVEEGITVLVDPRRMEQVVANLVDNAVAHGGPPWRIEAEQLGDEVRVGVIDHGPGVSEEIAPAMFSGWRGSGGRGFGLGLVRGLVEAMGGRVWYERDEAAGETAFRLSVPAPARGI